jgi:hypothetical protein
MTKKDLRQLMRKLIILSLILLPVFCFADEVTYPTPDTAIKDGVTYKLQKSSGIYQKIENAKEIKE